MPVAAGLKREVADALDRRAERRWDRAGDAADTMDLARLRTLRTRAEGLSARLNRFLHLSGRRLSLPHEDAARVPLPLHADWAWRPAPWAGPLAPRSIVGLEDGAALSDDTRAFHDCPLCEATVRQDRSGAAEGAPFAVALDVLGFEGSFFSFAVEFPPEGAKGLGPRHVVGLTVDARAERPMEFFARLNVRQGPNTAQIVREAMLDEGPVALEFDLAYGAQGAKGTDRAWVDLIFDTPGWSRIVLADVTLTRRPRAAL